MGVGACVDADIGGRGGGLGLGVDGVEEKEDVAGGLGGGDGGGDGGGSRG